MSADPYPFWGRHPVAYRILPWFATMGQPRAMRRRALEALAPAPGDVVLDLAAGTGANLAGLENRVGPQGLVVGLDRDSAMLAAAGRRVAEADQNAVRLVLGDALHLPVRPGSLDGALCTLALSAMPDASTAVREMHRALKPGARLVVLDNRRLRGGWRVLNPLTDRLFAWLSGWDPDMDVVGALRATFGEGEVEVRSFTGGSLFLAEARKPVA